LDVNIGNTAYRLIAASAHGRWSAHAVRVGSGERFGIDAVGATEQAAIDALTRWLEWHHAHAQALEALQHAERDYHRAFAGAAFATPGDASTGADKRSALELLDSARARLDDVRARRPAM
jgi:hypothetical protein